MPVFSTKRVITEADDNSTKHTGVHLTFDITPIDQIPKEYYKVAANLFQTIKDETKSKVGEGVADAAFNALFSNKSKEDIEKQTDKNAFVFIVPRKLTFAIWGSTPRKYKEFADDVLRKAGFKKGKNDTVATNSYYWYKFSSDKKHAYVVYYVAPVGMIPASFQLQMSIRCVEKNDNNAFVWESTAVNEFDLSNILGRGNRKVSNDSSFKPDPMEAKRQRELFARLMSKHGPKIKSIILDQLSKCKNTKFKRAVKPVTRIQSDDMPSKMYINSSSDWYYSYSIMDWNLYDAYPNPRAAMQNGETEDFFKCYNEVKHRVEDYCIKNIPGAVIDDGGDWDEGMMEVYVKYNGDMVVDESTYFGKRTKSIKHEELIREQSAQEIASKQALGSIFDTSKDEVEFDSMNIRKYIPAPEVENTFVEFFDCKDQITRRKLMTMTEAEHNSTLTNLTSKLYDQIVKRAHNIDYGEIPKTKGDIAKLSNYEDLMDTLGIIKGIVKEYKQDSKPVDDISVAISNIAGRKDMFERAFRYDCELPILTYNNLVMAIVAGVSFMITSCIEFIKAPRDESFTIQLDKVAYNKSKDALLYSSLSKFNKSCESGDFDKAMNYILDKKIRKFTGITIGAGIVATVIILVNIVPLLRELTYFFFYIKNNISDFFAVQSDLLTMNAYNVRNNRAIDDDKKNDIVEKQLAIASRFKEISNKFAIDKKKAEVEATRDIEKSSKKYKLDQNADIVAEDDDDGSDTSVLF